MPSFRGVDTVTVNQEYEDLLRSRHELLQQGEFDAAFKAEAASQKCQANKVKALQLANEPEDEDLTARKKVIARRFYQSSFLYLMQYFHAWYTGNPSTTRAYALGYQASLNLAEANQQDLRYFVAFRTEEWEEEINRLQGLARTEGIAGIDFRFVLKDKIAIETAMRAAGVEQQRRCIALLTHHQRFLNTDNVPDFVFRQLEYVLRDANVGV